MLDVAIDTRARVDEAIRSLLITRAAAAHRLADWILHDPEAAEDAVQEAALLAWDRRRSLRSLDTFEAWFNKILVNACRAELRRRTRRPVVTAIEPTIEPATDGGHGRLPVRDELGRAISRLTPDEQIVVALRFGRDLAIQQIAAETGWAEGTVKSRLHYALQHLRAALEADRRAEETLR
jgi:RNA polymerase sigma-70 factor (ECF subfamily)